jgi:hypothetical protein
MEQIVDRVDPPVGRSPASLFTPAMGDKPEADHLGELHSLAIPPKVIARVTADPKLPPFPVVWAWTSPGYAFVSANHKGNAFYNEHGRNDQSEVLQFTTSSLTATFDFRGAIQGGVFVARCSVNWRRIQDGKTGTTAEAEQQFSILGDNPTKSAVRAAVGSLPLQVVAYKESRFRQFDNAGLPLFGPPNGFGVMQLDNPRPSARQLWDWRQNAAGGVSLFQTKERETNQHYKNIYTAHPKAPKLSAEQLQLALYQYYNGGWYWDLDVASNTWKKTGSVAYGDDCVRIEKLVKSGNPPGDWN